ncbi:MAG: hypothetical protein P8129_17905 [Anaerolineae bacterium]|jgi:hypothetical protein
MKYKTILFLTLSLLIAGLLAGCQVDTVEVGMVETHLPGNWRASYRTFSGTKRDTFRAEAGQTLRLAYDVVVERGNLTIEVQDPDGKILWDASLQENKADVADVSLQKDGRYTLVVRGNDTGGRWNLTWDVR